MKQVLLLIFYHQSYIWQNSGSRVIGQNAVSQIAGFFKIKYLKREVNDEVYFWHADKPSVFCKSVLSFWV